MPTTSAKSPGFWLPPGPAGGGVVDPPPGWVVPPDGGAAVGPPFVGGFEGSTARADVASNKPHAVAAIRIRFMVPHVKVSR